jgi:hypothetical protein
MAPIRKIRVARKAIAVRQKQARTRGIAVAAHFDPRAVIESDFEGFAGYGQFKRHASL